MVLIPMKEYRELIEIKTRFEILKTNVKGETYLNKLVADVYGIEPPKKDEE